MIDVPFLHYGRHQIDEADVDAVVRVLRSDFLTQGPVVERFEEALAHRVGARHAVVVSSGTAALHIACIAAGLDEGGRGLTSALTFVASANSMLLAGGEALVADIDPVTLGLSADAVAAAVAAHPDLRVVMPVHFAGLAGDAAGVRAAAGERIVIEDAAHALGGTYADGQPIGSGAHADMTVFSLHPVKSITTGEGGVVTTNDDDLARRLRLARNHGIERDPDRFVEHDQADDGVYPPWHYEQHVLGLNYRMTDIQAALGLSQIERLDLWVERRRELAAFYDEQFADVPLVEVPQSDGRSHSALHLYVAHIDFAALGTTRAAFVADLRSDGVGAQVHYIPVYRQPFYRDRYGWDRADFPVTERHFARALSLPLHPGLSDADAERVVGAVHRVVAGG